MFCEIILLFRQRLSYGSDAFAKIRLVSERLATWIEKQNFREGGAKMEGGKILVEWLTLGLLILCIKRNRNALCQQFQILINEMTTKHWASKRLDVVKGINTINYSQFVDFINLHFQGQATEI